MCIMTMMNWIVADLLMFACSVAIYVAIRKASLDKLPHQFNNLAMFAIPATVFVVGALATRQDMSLTLSQAFQVIFTGIVLSYLGSAMSMRSIELAPNAGYSLIISKSYVVLTSILAVPLFGAHLTIPAIIAILLIVGFSALIMINPKATHHAKSSAWAPLAIGTFFCWAFLQIMAKHFNNQGVSAIVFLAYFFTIAAACIVVEMLHRNIRFELVRRHARPFVTIGIASSGFNFFNFYAVSIAPNVGFVNATNAASIGAFTMLSVVLFKDELTKRKFFGVIGVMLGLILLFLVK